MTVQMDVGSWGLFCGRSGRQIVLVDENPCGPVSARKITRSIPRKLLLDENRVGQVFEHQQAVTEEVELDGRRWMVQLSPVFSPKTNSLIGVFAGVAEAGQTLGEVPKIGVWEWFVGRGECGQATADRRTYWNRGMYDLYDFTSEEAIAHEGHWESGAWVNNFVYEADRVRLGLSIRKGIRDGLTGISGTFRCLTYNIMTRPGMGGSRKKHLRLVGQVVPVQPTDTSIVLQGFTYEAPEDFHDVALEQDAARVDDILCGVMALSSEPIAVVDAVTLDVLMTSRAWRVQDFGHAGGLAEIAQGDPAELHKFIAKAADSYIEPVSMPVCLRRTDGSEKTVRMIATGIDSLPEERDVVVRLDL